MINWLRNLFRDKTFGVARSSGWSDFRRTYIKSECEVCSARYFLELHHVLPFWKYPELELFPSNVVTACRKCHFSFCHYFSWSSWNDKIKEDIERIKNKP